MRRCSKLVTESKAMRELMSRVALIAPSDAPVVLLGESGTGKEVLARLLHANSPRAKRPFVGVNVGALPPDLLESELFGHVKGAFSGAVSDARGLFVEADGGTLLLDEIAEMPANLQVKLLRALQDGEIRRVGDSRAFSVDVRIFCATHRDLERHVREGRFREDLYYRLKVFALHVPPLRERLADLAALAEAFLEQEPGAKKLTAATRELLLAYRWPGNVRELGNAMQHAAVLARGGPIEPRHLPEEIARPRPAATPATRKLADVEREHILAVLQACEGRQAEAAKVLGIGRTTLWRKLASYAGHV
jgi:two-component system response regulator HydG